MLRKSIELMAIPHEFSQAAGYITISLGVTAAIPGPEDSVQDFINCADKALYQAKSSGRNRTRIYR